MNKEGVEFVYFQSREQGFWESQDQSSSHSYGYTDGKKSSCSTSEIGSAADARDARADCPTTTVNVNAACLNPG
jgi:hypothetical protein